MTIAELQHVAGCVSSDAEEARVTERNQSGVTNEHVQPESEDCVKQDLAGDVNVVDPRHPIRQRRERDDSNAESEIASTHGTCLPKRPCGRSSRTRNMERKKTKYASAGRSA